MAWYEVINGSGNSDYNKKLYSILGQKFGIFYFNKKGRIHVFLNTNTRYSFIKQSVEMDPIDAMPEMNHFYISGKRKDKDYYESGIEFENFRDNLEKLKEGQGIMAWFIYYNQKEKKDEYVLKEDKFLVRIIITEKLDRLPGKDKKNVEDITIIDGIQDSIKTQLYWKEKNGKQNKLYSGKIHVSPFIPKKKVLYTYKATIENFLKLDYSTKDMRLPGTSQKSEPQQLIDFHRGQPPVEMAMDEKTEALTSLVRSAKTAIIYGNAENGQISISSRLISMAGKNGRKVLVLNNVRFNPFKNNGIGEIENDISQFDLSSEYYNSRIIFSTDGAFQLADKLWSEILNKVDGLYNPLLIINNVNNITPITTSGMPKNESEFWSTFFRHYNEGTAGLTIVFLRSGEPEALGLYVNTVIKSENDGIEPDFKVVKD
ncbi:MAG: hypothetical protein QXZ44_05560 [Ferroplasma sp.]